MTAAACPAPTVPGLETALLAALAGDEAGFIALYRDLQPRLLRYATALVGSEAEDVTAETWLHVAKDLSRFSGDLDGFRGWVTRICRNRAMDSARDRARRPTQVLELSELLDSPALADVGRTDGTAFEQLDTRWALAQILALPRTEAEAVLLRAVVGLDAPAAGRVLGKRPGAVRVAAHRGLRRLAERLEAGSSPDTDGTDVVRPREAGDA
ncbi:sigma-70 family RNA polymerase sigma factor [Pseudonocardia xishanensis]|uniref:RNA polymerase sigma factor n=1 Tax=Pseudonocardia xishanensis TaxID=630995 RepID=A0ABP8RME0_9PSEU